LPRLYVAGKLVIFWSSFSWRNLVRKNKSSFALASSPAKAAQVALAAVCCLGLSAHAADSNVDLGKLKMEGFFMHDPNAYGISSDAPHPFIFAYFQPSNNQFFVSVWPKVEGRDPQFGLTVADDDIYELAGSKKLPKSYTFTSHRGQAGKAFADYRESKISCYTTAGKLTITALGQVDGLVSGTFSGMKWDGENCAALGSSGTFKVKRAVDR
jgi:hypothetical protein